VSSTRTVPGPWRWWPSPQKRDVLGAVLLAALLLYGAIGEAYPTNRDNQIVDGRPVPHPPVVAYSLVLIACLVLIWRRQHPWITYAVSLGTVLIYVGLGYVYGAVVIAPIIALYNLATTIRPRHTAWLGLITFVVFGATALAGPFQLGIVTIVAFEIVAAIALGIAVGNHQAYIAAVEERAEHAERTRQREARRMVEAERLRIARELHDVVAHTISMINIQSRVATQVIHHPPPEGAQALQAITESSGEALRELRGILGLLRQPDDVDQTAPAPGLGQLEALVESTRQAGLPTTLVITGDNRHVPPSVDIAAYRIVQESLTNALRHAGPANATVSLEYRAADLTVTITDTGTNSAPTSATDGTGHGIIGMRERAHAVGGTLCAGPRHDGGFQVAARLPLP
jgi:signal transduction histidine kinase